MAKRSLEEAKSSGWREKRGMKWLHNLKNEVFGSIIEMILTTHSKPHQGPHVKILVDLSLVLFVESEKNGNQDIHTLL